MADKVRATATTITFAISTISVVVPLLVWVSNYDLPITTDLVCYDDNCTVSGPVYVTLNGVVASDATQFDKGLDDVPREPYSPGQSIYDITNEVCNRFPASSSAQRACFHRKGISTWLCIVLAFMITVSVISGLEMWWDKDGNPVANAFNEAADQAERSAEQVADTCCGKLQFQLPCCGSIDASKFVIQMRNKFQVLMKSSSVRQQQFQSNRIVQVKLLSKIVRENQHQLELVQQFQLIRQVL